MSNKTYLYDQLKFKTSLAGKVRKLEEDVYGVIENNKAFLADYKLSGPIQDEIVNIKEQIANLPEDIDYENVQSDWNETDPTSEAYIKNKPNFKTINGQSITGSGDINLLNALGADNGVATLDSNGKVLSSQLPSYVDDVIESSSPDDYVYIRYYVNSPFEFLPSGMEFEGSYALINDQLYKYISTGGGDLTWTLVNESTEFDTGVLYRAQDNKYYIYEGSGHLKEVINPAFPLTGESGKIYVDTDTNKTYRWSGSQYVEISPSLTLGETASTAYRGDRGKIAYDHSQTPHPVFSFDDDTGTLTITLEE